MFVLALYITKSWNVSFTTFFENENKSVSQKEKKEYTKFLLQYSSPNLLILSTLL